MILWDNGGVNGGLMSFQWDIAWLIGEYGEFFMAQMRGRGCTLR